MDANSSWTGATDSIWSIPLTGALRARQAATDTAVIQQRIHQPAQYHRSYGCRQLHMTTGVAQNVTISSTAANILTIEGVGGTGILIDNTNAFTLTITARVGLDASQTWTNNSGNLFTVSGATLGLGEDNTLTVNGTGNTLISGVIMVPAVGVQPLRRTVVAR